VPPPEVDYTIFTDASNEGWGASDNNITINGRWSEKEKEMHINEQELVAIKYAILSYLKSGIQPKHIKIMSDNATAISYINKYGGCKSKNCNIISSDIWGICIAYGVHISAAHIPGKHNVVADIASREFRDSAEWMLNPDVFRNICETLGTPEIDLFATRLNKQLPEYVSWLPDPGSQHIDAMSISSSSLQLPGTKKRHPMSPKMKLLVVLCSRDLKQQEKFLITQQKFCKQRGGRRQQTNIQVASRGSQSFVVKDRLVQCMPILH